jgi:hypothetical protein
MVLRQHEGSLAWFGAALHIAPWGDASQSQIALLGVGFLLA